MSRKKRSAATNLTLVPPPVTAGRTIELETLPESDLLALAGGWTWLDGSNAVFKAGGLKPLLRKSITDLEADGFEYGIAAQVAAIAEVARRLARKGDSRPVLKTAEAIYEYLKPDLMGRNREEFWVLALNSCNTLIRAERVARGTINSCAVDPRDVFSVAVAAKASAIVVAHNHPSGDPTPSGADIILTQQLMCGAELLCVRLLDHIIVGDNNFCSMASRGDLAEVSRRLR